MLLLLIEILPVSFPCIEITVSDRFDVGCDVARQDLISPTIAAQTEHTETIVVKTIFLDISITLWKGLNILEINTFTIIYIIIFLQNVK